MHKLESVPVRLRATLAVAFFISFTTARAQVDSAAAACLTPQELADRVSERFLAQPKYPVNYNNDLILIALLAMHDATGEQRYLESVQQVMSRREMPPGYVHPFRSQPFCSISFELYWRTKDQRDVQPFVSETARYRAEVPRSFDGAVSHYGDPAMGRILLDQIQDYAARMARAGRLSGDSSSGAVSTTPLCFAGWWVGAARCGAPAGMSVPVEGVASFAEPFSTDRAP